MILKTGKSLRASSAFLDTNILVYHDDSRDPAKQKLALNLITDHLRNRNGVISIQVLQEYFVAVTRKLGFDASLAKRKIEVFANFRVVEPGVSDILAAVDLHRLHRISFWDALVLQSARGAGCNIIFTEDMQHGQVIDGVQIVNPFL